MTGAPASICCPTCRSPLPGRLFNTGGFEPCPACSSQLKIAAFPALGTARTCGQSAEDLLSDEEAGCFHHPDKRAVLACESCGRFLCALCDIDIAGRHLCPSCVQSGTRRGAIPTLSRQRVAHDRVAMSWALLALFLNCTAAASPWLGASLVFIPLAISTFICIRHWNTPFSLVRTSKARFAWVIVIIVLQGAAWAAAGLYELSRHG
jgi:hypothetical protein